MVAGKPWYPKKLEVAPLSASTERKTWSRCAVVTPGCAAVTTASRPWWRISPALCMIASCASDLSSICRDIPVTDFLCLGNAVIGRVDWDEYSPSVVRRVKSYQPVSAILLGSEKPTRYVSGRFQDHFCLVTRARFDNRQCSGPRPDVVDGLQEAFC